MPVFRRRILIKTDPLAAGVRYRAALEDDFHHFRVDLVVRDGRIVSTDAPQPVDQSIQPGDGGWGIPIDLYGYFQLTETVSTYLQASYLVTPETDTRTLARFYLVADKTDGLDFDSKPVQDFIAAVSVGVFQGVPLLDLDYAEDSTCETDMNVVMTGGGGFVEVQGTAEGAPFTAAQMQQMLALAQLGIGELLKLQRQALAGA